MFKQLLRFVFFLAFFISTQASAEQRVIEDYEIKGISGELESNVELYLKQLVGEKPTRALRRYAKKQVQSSIKALGYYNPTVDIEFDKDDKELIVKVERGPATRIEAINITLNGEGKNDSQLQNVIKNLNLTQGDVLNHGRYDSAHKKIESMLLELGYFDAKWPARKLAVSVQKNSAVITFNIDTGVRYTYGNIIIASETPAEKYIHSLAPFTQG